VAFAGALHGKPVARAATALLASGDTCVALADESGWVALFRLGDALRPQARELVRRLARLRCKVTLLSGDSHEAVGRVARELGIADAHGAMNPQDKHDFVARLQRQGAVVAMVGDGVNDAPALAQADVGIAMGTGTDIAIESAGVTLVKGDLRGLVRARRLSKATMSNIRQNLFFAFVYNAAGVPIAAGILYPWLGVLLSPMIASAAMTFSSVSVIGNALRLRRVAL
jgi:Cu+-exporting ATPase